MQNAPINKSNGATATRNVPKNTFQKKSKPMNPSDGVWESTMLPITTCAWAKVGFCEWGLRKVLDSGWGLRKVLDSGWGLRKVLDSGKSKMVTKWVPNGSNCIISPSFCISHRDLSNGGLPEANKNPKIRMCIFWWKKSPCGNARRLVRFFKKDCIFV